MASLNLVGIIYICLALLLERTIAQQDDYDCPSSDAMVHAGCKVYTVFENPCSTVQQEMMKRVNGQAGEHFMRYNIIFSFH